MKSLYERLTPEALAAIEKETNRYPSTWKSINEGLKQNYWVIDLTLGTVTTMASCEELRTAAGVDSYFEFKSIVALEKLFIS